MSFKIGDTVVCRCPGSWVDGRIAIIEDLNVQSSDAIYGHLLKVPGKGITVVEPEFLEYFVPGVSFAEG